VESSRQLVESNSHVMESSSDVAESFSHLAESNSHALKSSSHLAEPSRIEQVFCGFLESYSSFCCFLRVICGFMRFFPDDVI
jgi:hypothetical protein